jgi:hypothetical protein
MMNASGSIINGVEGLVLHDNIEPVIEMPRRAATGVCMHAMPCGKLSTGFRSRLSFALGDGVILAQDDKVE